MTRDSLPRLVAVFRDTLRQEFHIELPTTCSHILRRELSRHPRSVWDDFCQVLLLEILEIRRAGDDLQPALLLRLIRRVAMQFRRHCSKLQRWKQASAEAIPDPEAGPPQQAHGRELLEAIRGLPTLQTLLLYRYYFEGSTLADLAKEFGLSTSSVHRLVSDARRQLRRMLNDKP